MSLKELASTMSAQGRGPDDVLVHMSTKELNGLQGLAMAAGGSLTVNPKTGLPEAGFLDSILPTILGIGAMFIPGMQPLGAAAIGAGSKAVLDPNASFMDIALAGLGGYGGAQLGAGLSGVGASAAQAAAVPLAETAGQTAMQQLAQQSGAAIGQGMQQFGAEGLKNVGNLGLQATPAASSVAAPMNYQMAAAAPEALSTQLVAPSTMAYAPPTSLDAQIAARNKAMVDVYQGAASDFNNLPFMDKVGQSTKALMSPETGGLGAFTREMGGTIPTLKAAGMAAAPMLMASPKMENTSGSDDEAEMAKRRYKYAAQPTGNYYGTNDDFGTYERQYFTQPTFTKLAKGGIVDLKKGGFVVPADVVSALGNGSSEAGLEMLSKRFGAKPIKGKGDGQSDSIPAKIDRKQPAAVARDEAYLNPAQVKKAGGAKKLYAMMDKIRTQAHGKKEQQRPVNPRAALA